VPWVDANGVSLRYELAGAGVPIVLFHELGGGAESWASVVPHLSRRFRTLAYDQRGAGLSEKTRDAFTYDTLVDDFAALVEAIGIEPPFHLMGVAAGATLALLVADRHPDWVRSLILGNPAVLTSPERVTYADMRGAAAEQQGMRAILPLTLGRSFPPETASDPIAYARYLGLYFANDARSFALAGQALARNTAASTLARVRARTLVLAGHEDAIRPSSESSAIAQAIANARFEVIEGGHFLHVGAPHAMLAAVDAFLAL
jgi:3-oxoadipate enol-lactonase